MRNYSENSFRKFYVCLMFVEYITSKLIGLSPWMMDTPKIFRKNREVAGSSYNILLIISYILFDIFFVYNNLNTVNQTIASIAAKLAFFSIICMSIILLIYIIRQKSLVIVKNRFNDVDKWLNGCVDYQLDHDNTNYWIFFTNMVLIYCWSIVRIVFTVSWAIDIALILTMAFGFILIVQYTMIINMINKRLKSINATLLKLGSTSQRAILNDFCTIKNAYVELCDMSDKIADFYRIPTLIVVFLSCIRNINNIYQIILIFLHQAEIPSSAYLGGIFIIQICFSFTILTTSVTQVLRLHLSNFSNDLWHMKFEFTLCDIIPLDRTLLAVISGTTVTYLIIAIQFHLSKN
ncbi:Protein of unknown function [Cotesia congregata]|uniref:Gustatory receptor n=1 Tax=Cotesia congregata TaxID=51543 RepID=A0A8J2HK14_COTCN|nr:Protein of unknown function [Cotesia congregata]